MRIRNVVTRLRNEGFAKTIQLMAARTNSFVRSRFEDLRRGVSTSRELDDRDLGIQDVKNHWYVATDYQTFRSAMRHVPVRPGKDVFVDLGAGMGRTLLLAGELPFRKVIGVEFSPKLVDIGRKNLHAAGEGLKCRNVELVLADATQWAVPHDATVLFLFNPFDGQVLSKVCENIQRSLAEAPRALTMVYVRPDKYFEKEIAWQQWLTRKHQLPCVEGKVAIYESKPART
jgi:SAM-dependent methyltransferase